MNAKRERIQSEIASFALYSEERIQVDPEFIHIEDIKSRAELFDWRIGIHAHPEMFQLLYLQSGEARVYLDGYSQYMEGPCVVTIPHSVVHGFDFVTQDTLGFVVTISHLVLLEERFVRSYPFTEEMMRRGNVIALAGSAETLRFLNQVMLQLQEEYAKRPIGNTPMFEWLVYCLLLKLGRCLEFVQKPAPESGYEVRHRELCELVERHFREHLPNDFYAEKLCTTVSNLNRICRASTGKTIGQLIQERLTLEAQCRLVYSSKPISLVAYDLGFADPAYFSRFFKRRVGVSPRAFRERRNQG